MTTKLYFQFTRAFDKNLVILNPQPHQDETGYLHDSVIYRQDDEIDEGKVNFFVADYPEYLKPACEGYYYYRGHTKEEVRADLIALGHEEKEIYLSDEDMMEDEEDEAWDDDEEDEDEDFDDEDDFDEDD